MPVTPRLSAFAPGGCPPRAARRITRRFHRLSASGWWVAYALRTRPPLSRPPKGPLPSDLHVLGLPLAFILSQDQTLRCIIVFSSFSLSHGLRFVFSTPSQVPFTPRPLPSRAPAAGLCWPQALKDRSAKPPCSQTLSPSFCGCKSTTFSLTDNDFFYLFFIVQYNSLTISLKNFIVNMILYLLIHLLIYKTFFSLMNHQITSPKQSK